MRHLAESSNHPEPPRPRSVCRRRANQRCRPIAPLLGEAKVPPVLTGRMSMFRKFALAFVLGLSWMPTLVSAANAPLAMTCHELIGGAPDPDGNQYVLNGDVLTNHVSGEIVFLSSSKLTLLQRYPSKHVSTWSKHKVVGHKVHRTVYRKNDVGRTVGVIREVYDFDRQTVRDDLDRADSCHHSGR